MAHSILDKSFNYITFSFTISAIAAAGDDRSQIRSEMTNN